MPTPTPVHPALVEDLRTASRALVRALGFTGTDFAGTDLSPSAVHALIEIERGRGALTARELGERLRLEKSSVSRMLRKLVASGEVEESAGAQDARVKRLALSALGRQRVEAIHAFAREQVAAAMARLAPGQDRAVLEGVRLYAAALAPPGPEAPVAAAPPPVEVRCGYRPGLIARITEMHALYYAREAGFGQRFESVVAGGLAEFCGRLAPRSPALPAPNGLWTAEVGGRTVGSVAIDGEDLAPGVAHLRWFIVDDGVRGGGVGRRLLASALAFVDAQSTFSETHLWTFSGLQAARRLYEAHGFACVEERPGSQWGREVMEQRFVRRRP
ncbi:MarR family winged helix-turn-helix transcriptional regulator [Paracidovorax konjaci]|uniref:DNA-binding transcriptional regulator, MarR family n=1 Tax=Paracidovorax konjaci TaxID=32040 RepID=A0A1I1XIS9_9BURK|nr:MarR family winged helix-turn-helix transcriptional regulator [Paracidovorax konjaci]SFE07246.1 DNA-binding transcriptional regulator, MarR family [Paracidovorax konjaci]